jgi:murein DD-endopeptidase MepM/ murein hydrolase activator NlpD
MKKKLSPIILLALGTCLLLTAQSAIAENPYPFKARLERRAGRIVVVAYNDGPATVSAVINVSSSNCSVDAAANLRIVVKALDTLVIPQVVRAASPGIACQAGLKFKYQMGDFGRSADDEPYRIPFADSKPHRVEQAFGGPLTSHNSPESQYALDIDLPEGTKIVAARDGRVVDFAFGYDNAGSVDAEQKLKANFVLIEHEDGALTIYSHLAHRPVSLQLGGSVQAGDLIGYSGNTGYSSGPHLHFAVLKPYVKEDGTLVSRALPFMLYSNAKKDAFVPRRGMQLQVHDTAVAASP